uniref:Centromere protein S n=1 Tax=Sparus aurata TaxID=8175 RepID=A0A671WE19_SPAAU
MSVDKDETHQRLKAAVHYTVGRICQKMGEDQRRRFSRQVVAAIAETTFRQCGGCEKMLNIRFNNLPDQ